MEEKLDDGGYWLPLEFLTEDDLLTDFKAESFRVKGGDDFPYGFGFGSDLSSPVESVTGSTEAESDENDFIAFLKRKIAYSTIQEVKTSSDYPTKGWKLCGSPQSTLYGCKPCSSKTSPRYISGHSSPPEMKDSMEWDLIYAAAEEVARMGVKDQKPTYYSNEIYSQPSKPCPVTFSRANPTAASEFYPNHKTQAQLSYQQLRAIQLQQIQRETWGSGKSGERFHSGKWERTQGLSTVAWPTLLQSQQQQPKPMPTAGMRAVFLPENGAKKERTGTGVFLPRRYEVTSSHPDPRKKPGSSVLLPDRVVQALNLNLDSIDIPAAPTLSRGNANFAIQYEAALKHRTNVMMAQKMRNSKPQPVLNQEFWLPPEWTY